MSRPSLEWILWPALLALGGAIAIGVLALPAVDPGLAPMVDARLDVSGVDNPVTAVLLNFRSYDTLLEIAVLTLAVTGIWSLTVMPERRIGDPGLVLTYLVKILVPFLILFGAYLLWAGSHEPGGAFQAGVVFAAAGVLMVLSGAPLPPLGPCLQRTLMMLGLATFAGTGAALMLVERLFLQYPITQAKHLILLIEIAAAISIGAILTSAFRGGRPRGPDSEH